MPRGKRLTKEDHQRILDLHNVGMANAVIAFDIGITADAVRRIIRQSETEEIKYSLKWAEAFRQEWDYWTTMIGGRRCG